MTLSEHMTWKGTAVKNTSFIGDFILTQSQLMNIITCDFLFDRVLRADQDLVELQAHQEVRYVFIM